VPFLVDGDNLLGTWPGRQRSDADRRRLAMELGRFAATARRRVVTIFDGTAPPGAAFGANVQFSGRGKTADEVILEILRGEKDRRGWIVATSDRSLGDQCRHLDARVERCDRFRQRLTGPGGAEKPERETDLAYWLQAFGGDDPETGDE